MHRIATKKLSHTRRVKNFAPNSLPHRPWWIRKEPTRGQKDSWHTHGAQCDFKSRFVRIHIHYNFRHIFCFLFHFHHQRLLLRAAERRPKNKCIRNAAKNVKKNSADDDLSQSGFIFGMFVLSTDIFTVKETFFPHLGRAKKCTVKVS